MQTLWYDGMEFAVFCGQAMLVGCQSTRDTIDVPQDVYIGDHAYRVVHITSHALYYRPCEEIILPALDKGLAHAAIEGCYCKRITFLAPCELKRGSILNCQRLESVVYPARERNGVRWRPSEKGFEKCGKYRMIDSDQAGYTIPQANIHSTTDLF